jgi:hypothetical protein
MGFRAAAIETVRRGEECLVQHGLVDPARVLSVPLGAAADQIGTPLAEPICGEWRTSAMAWQALQTAAVSCLDMRPGITRKASVVVAGRSGMFLA